MRSNPISWIRLVMLIALLSGISCSTWASATRPTGTPTTRAPAHSIDASANAHSLPAEASNSGVRVLPVRLDADDIEVRTVAANDFPPVAVSAREEREAAVRARTSEGPDAWTAMLATLLLAAFFFVRRTF
jgi:MYXO-CTERM domain-containing protein